MLPCGHGFPVTSLVVGQVAHERGGGLRGREGVFTKQAVFICGES
jgi:hypothetical protein